MRHTVVAGYKKVAAIRDDIFILRLVPVHPSSIREGNYSNDLVLLEYLTLARTFTIAKVKTVLDFGNW